MKRTTFLSTLLVAALGIVMATPASATTYTWVGGASGAVDDWQVKANWNPSSAFPVRGDTAIIPNVTHDPVIDQQAEAVTTLTINNGGVLTITGQTLTVDGSTQTLNGFLVLSDSTAKVEFTHTAADVTLSGRGGIKGEHASAEIRLNASDLDSDVDIFGMLKIIDVGGTTSFNNGSTGVVRADDNGVLLFDSTLDSITDESGAAWSAETNSGATLKFDAGACLINDLLIDDCATLSIDGVTVGTQGDVTQTSGTISLPNSGELNEGCNSECSDCNTVSAGTNC